MPKYMIPVTWRVFGEVGVDAPDLTAAHNAARDGPIPVTQGRDEGSLEVDEFAHDEVFDEATGEYVIIAEEV